MYTTDCITRFNSGFATSFSMIARMIGAGKANIICRNEMISVFQIT